MSVREVRTSLEHLKSTGEISLISTARFTVFTINNYEEYQKIDFAQVSYNNLTTVQKSTNQTTNQTTNSIISENRINTDENHSAFLRATNQTTNQTTNYRQTTDKLPTNYRQQWKKDKESKRKIKKRERGALSPHGQFENVFLSDLEVADLRAKYPNHYEAKIERLSRVIESKGKNYADHYATLIDWLMQDVGLPGKAAQGDSTDSSYDIDALEEINRLDYVE
jgi:hypothetical protein